MTQGQSGLAQQGTNHNDNAIWTLDLSVWINALQLIQVLKLTKWSNWTQHQQQVVCR